MFTIDLGLNSTCRTVLLIKRLIERMDRSYLLFPAGMILYDPPNSCPMPMLTVVGGFLPLVAWRAVEVDLAGRDRVRLKNGWMQVEGGGNV